MTQLFVFVAAGWVTLGIIFPGGGLCGVFFAAVSVNDSGAIEDGGVLRDRGGEDH